MSWIVERLLMDRHSIRENYTVDRGKLNQETGDIYSKSYFSETFDKLIFLEQKIEQLYNKKHLSDKEIEVIKKVQENKPFIQISKEMNLSRSTITTIFRNACRRVAYHLGGYYTDEGFLDHMKSVYNLNDREIQLVEEKINSRFRHSI
jgi:hypothetical protein